MIYPAIMIHAEFRQKFELALATAKRLPPKEAFDRCADLAKAYNLSYEYAGSCDGFVVHEENRSKLMLSAGKAHEVGERIHFAGADLNELRTSYAFELSKIPSRRAMQLEKNANLIRRANGLLADLNGMERFATVGSSHVSQFCKFSKQGGKTCRPKLQDEAGMLDVARLKKSDL